MGRVALFGFLVALLAGALVAAYVTVSSPDPSGKGSREEALLRSAAGLAASAFWVRGEAQEATVRGLVLSAMERLQGTRTARAGMAGEGEERRRGEVAGARVVAEATEGAGGAGGEEAAAALPEEGLDPAALARDLASAAGDGAVVALLDRRGVVVGHSSGGGKGGYSLAEVPAVTSVLQGRSAAAGGAWVEGDPSMTVAALLPEGPGTSSPGSPRVVLAWWPLDDGVARWLAERSGGAAGVVLASGRRVVGATLARAELEGVEESVRLQDEASEGKGDGEASVLRVPVAGRPALVAHQRIPAGPLDLRLYLVAFGGKEAPRSMPVAFAHSLRHASAEALAAGAGTTGVLLLLYLILAGPALGRRPRGRVAVPKATVLEVPWPAERTGRVEEGPARAGGPAPEPEEGSGPLEPQTDASVPAADTAGDAAEPEQAGVPIGPPEPTGQGIRGPARRGAEAVWPEEAGDVGGEPVGEPVSAPGSEPPPGGGAGPARREEAGREAGLEAGPAEVRPAVEVVPTTQAPTGFPPAEPGETIPDVAAGGPESARVPATANGPAASSGEPAATLPEGGGWMELLLAPPSRPSDGAPAAGSREEGTAAPVAAAAASGEVPAPGTGTEGFAHVPADPGAGPSGLVMGHEDRPLPPAPAPSAAGPSPAEAADLPPAVPDRGAGMKDEAPVRSHLPEWMREFLAPPGPWADPGRVGSPSPEQYHPEPDPLDAPASQAATDLWWEKALGALEGGDPEEGLRRLPTPGYRLSLLERVRARRGRWERRLDQADRVAATVLAPPGRQAAGEGGARAPRNGAAEEDGRTSLRVPEADDRLPTHPWSREGTESERAETTPEGAAGPSSGGTSPGTVPMTGWIGPPGEATGEEARWREPGPGGSEGQGAAPSPPPASPEPAVSPAPPGPSGSGPAVDAGPIGSGEEASDDPRWPDLFSEFCAVRRQCGEDVEALDYPAFAARIRATRDEVMRRFGCSQVLFRVYVKNGRAALKAIPVQSS